MRRDNAETNLSITRLRAGNLLTLRESCYDLRGLRRSPACSKPGKPVCLPLDRAGRFQEQEIRPATYVVKQRRYGTMGNNGLYIRER